MGANDAAEMLEVAKAECLRLEQDLAARDADDIKRSEEGRTDWDYEQRIAALEIEVARLNRALDRNVSRPPTEATQVDGAVASE